MSMNMMSEDHSKDGSPSLCSQPTEWSEEAARLFGNSSLQASVQQIPERLNYPFWSSMFREAIRKSLHLDCVHCFVALCQKRCEDDHPYTRTHINRWQLEFAYSCMVTERPHFVHTICAEEHVTPEEVELLTDAAISEKSWTVLEPIFRVDRPGEVDRILVNQVEKCVVQMLLDESHWPKIAPAVEVWIKEKEAVMKLVRSLQSKLDICVSAVPMCVHWCLDNGHANLAFVLALTFKEWELVEMVTAFPSLSLHYSTMLDAADMIAKPERILGSFSAAAAILEACPLTEEVLDSPFLRRLQGKWELGRACQERGVWDYALMIGHRDLTYVLHSHRFCQNRTVLDRLLVGAVRSAGYDANSYWLNLAAPLLCGCTDQLTLQKVFILAARKGLVSLLGVLLNHVDPSLCVLDDDDNSLLFLVLAGRGTDECKTEVVRLLLAAGLSPFLRDVHSNTTVHCPNVPDNCPLKCAFRENLPDIFHLTMDCGAYSVKTLRAVASDAGTHRRAEQDEKLRKCYECVEEAACAPTNLQLLARLAVSRYIGCQPRPQTRAERIDSLPLPVPLKEKVKFNDVLNPQTEPEPCE